MLYLLPMVKLFSMVTKKKDKKMWGKKQEWSEENWREKWGKKKGLGTSITSGEAPLFGGVRKEEMKDRKKSKEGEKNPLKLTCKKVQVYTW
jgi:hypothetical protein